ncbi:MAG TPA: T9SS type A sorting domain-containing protein [Chitinophagales bacterium]|nr:T9SS type A sorting domain-containing protein [Chitinophagales bacterium]
MKCYSYFPSTCYVCSKSRSGAFKSIYSDEGTTYIDISELPAGVYIVEVKTEGQIVKTERQVKID